jgi:hypothetical protein
LTLDRIASTLKNGHHGRQTTTPLTIPVIFGQFLSILVADFAHTLLALFSSEGRNK